MGATSVGLFSCFSFFMLEMRKCDVIVMIDYLVCHKTRKINISEMMKLHIKYQSLRSVLNIKCGVIKAKIMKNIDLELSFCNV